MYRYKLTIEYDGTNYAGWQIQDNAVTVQGEIERAVARMCGYVPASQEISTSDFVLLANPDLRGLQPEAISDEVGYHKPVNKTPTQVVGSGRTDSGVHATGQVAHVDLPREYRVAEVVGALNFFLKPQPIVILDAQNVSADFHARFSAIKRYYTYRIIARKTRLGLDNNRAWQVKEVLDLEAMREGAKFLVGTHDFTSYRASLCQAKSPIKTIDEIRIEQHGELIEFHISARSFLHHMVRNIVGSLKMVGNGTWKPQQIAIALEAKNRAAAGQTAPACGLYLTRVDY